MSGFRLKFPAHIHRVHKETDVLNAALVPDINAVICPRDLQGDFKTVAAKILTKRKKLDVIRLGYGAGREIFPRLKEFTRALHSAECLTAIAQIQRDFELLRERGLDVELRVERNRPAKEPRIGGNKDGRLAKTRIVYCGGDTLGWAAKDCRIDLKKNWGAVCVKEGARPFVIKQGSLYKYKLGAHPDEKPFVYSEIDEAQAPRMFMEAVIGR
ncbi:MAG: hypothetical protein ACLFR0_00005 [Alphaproteobacteria bacterium]